MGEVKETIVTHLDSYDFIKTWCETDDLCEPNNAITHSLEYTTCLFCLLAIERFADNAARRRYGLPVDEDV